MRVLLPSLLLTACAAPADHVVAGFTVTVTEEGALAIAGAEGEPLHALRLRAGHGSANVEHRVGSYRFTEVEEDVGEQRSAVLEADGEALTVSVEDAAGALGTVTVRAGPSEGILRLTLTSADLGANRIGFSADCASPEHVLGMGLHAMDVDHAGQAFPLWVSEPGIGKVDTEVQPADWYARGTRHASSFPVPWALRPDQRHGLLLDAASRVDVDLCTDGERLSLTAWEAHEVDLYLVTGGTALEVVERLSDVTGRPELPPAWVFSPWTDAIRGSTAVRDRAALVRSAGASTSAIWTEDWRGAQSSAVVGYHPSPEWDLGAELYPDAEALAAELALDGFAWLAYFAPFVTEGTRAWDSAVAADALIRDEAGEIYTFLGPFFVPISVVDLSEAPGRDWVRTYLDGCLDVGFRGWMTDFAEWLPTDAVLANGMTGAEAHNLYPQWWQEVHGEAIVGTDASFFVRSGWTRTASTAPVVWAGDQRTDFQPDDGFPTVVAMGLGAGASGVGVFTHDVAGYQSATNPAGDEELWYRWAALGAFSPILRTHHGNESLENWQLDSSEATTARWAELTGQHMALFPYRYGLAARFAERGTPMVLPPALLFPEDDPGRMDVWMLGPSLLVAPVLERGATGRDVELPPGPRWFDWWTGELASSGRVEVPWDAIPVYAVEGSVIPTLPEAPETALVGAEGPTGLEEVDGARRVRVFGAGGSFTEADGTRYELVGAPTSAGTASWTGTSGAVAVGGAELVIEGSVSRAYEVVLVP
jgi:alpha-glucosidase